MDHFVVEGGTRLKGRATVSGAKNAALPLLAATLLAEGTCRLERVPRLRDITSMVDLLRTLGAEIEWIGENTLEMCTPGEGPSVAPYELVKKMRASICVLGPLLGRRAQAGVSLPGGCVIGPRPVDLHLYGLERLGTTIRIEGGTIHADGRALRGAGDIFLGGPFGPTVLGTANVLCAAVKSPGETVIQGAACEPEIADLARFLVAMGAKITGVGSPTLRVVGVDRLVGATHRVIPDRIEAGTLIAAAAATRGEVTIEGLDPSHLTAPLLLLERMGVELDRVGEQSLRVRGDGSFAPTDVVTLPYPGFPTDLQAQFMAMLALAEGNSFVTEKIYPERFIHIAELQRMGARIRKEGATAMVQGVSSLHGCPVMASDLRASAALVIAGLAAEGTTTVERVYHIDRGYERIEEKLASLGARITRRNS